MSVRRPVKVGDPFFELLDQQLGSERGLNGEPTATDFLLADLPPIAERFSTAFDELIMPIPDRPDYRAALSTGILVPRVLVTAVLDSDGGVTLLSVRMDFDWGPRVDLTGQGSNPQLARRCRTESASDQPLKSLPAEHLGASFQAAFRPLQLVGEPDRSALRAALRVRAEQLQPPQIRGADPTAPRPPQLERRQRPGTRTPRGTAPRTSPC